MVIALVGAVASLSIAVLSIYNRSTGDHPENPGNNVRKIRQSTSVILAIGNAVHAVLDALAMLSRGGKAVQVAVQGGQQQTPQFGRQLASDAG